MTTKISSRSAQITELIASRQEFDTFGALRATYHHYSPGYLPAPWQAEYDALARDRYDNPLYTVVSYGTPIAWHTERTGWIVPDVKYSVTTSRHQSNLYRVLATHWRRSGENIGAMA